MKAVPGALVAVILVALATVVPGCGPGIDVKQAIQITEMTGGWFDAGIKSGKNKLVPSVTFRVKKTVDQDVSPIALNLAFKKITAQGDVDFEDVYVQRVTFAEGNQSAPLTVRTESGYTGDPPQTRLQMLQHPAFEDLRVIFFVKHSSANWVEMARYTIPRTLLTR
jgi:hypothetical protein